MTVENIIAKLLGDISEAINLHGDGGDLSWSGISRIATCLSASAAQLTLKANTEVPFGRYLIHKDSNFNIQLDVFSENYIGAPHNHDTWGVLGVISGVLGVTDYQLAADSLVTLRKSILRVDQYRSLGHSMTGIQQRPLPSLKSHHFTCMVRLLI